MMRSLLCGAAAGAAGTTALNAVTYLDMALRGRPASQTPQQSVQALAGRAGVSVPGSGDKRENRLEGLGALSGMAAGIGTGTAYGMLNGLGWRPGPKAGIAAATGAALLAGNAPMTVLGVTDPRTWSRADWLSDIFPHLAYGVVTALTMAALDGPRRRWI